MTIIMSMLRRLKEVYPNRMTSIKQHYNIFGNGSEEILWSLYIEDNVCEDYDDFTSLVNAINKLTNTMTHIITVYNTADGKCNPFDGHEPSARNGWYRGD